MSKPVYSFVIPIFNEEETIQELHKQVSALLSRLDDSSEVILIDDGSVDRSYELMMGIQKKDPRFKLIRLSRNFGHQIAVTAGMDASQGKATIIMDADLQDPPEVVLEMIRKWKEGFEVVYAVRSEREGETFFKKMTAAVFYRVLRKLTNLDMPADVGDFRLVDRRALEAFQAMRESNRYVRGMFSWVGFKQTGVLYQRKKRFAGETKYPLHKMLKLARDAIVGFSYAPLRFTLNLGFFVSGCSLLYAFYAVTRHLLGITVTGWTSLAVLVSFLGGVQLVVIGLLGEYIGRIHEEVKRRPLYLVRATEGLEAAVFENTRTIPARSTQSR